MPDPNTTSEGAKALVYAGIGALALKAAEFFLKAFDVVHASHTTEMEATLEAAAQLREELRKDNEDLRKRMREMEARLLALENEHRSLVEAKDRLISENEDLRAELRLLRKDRFVDDAKREDLERQIREGRKP